MTDHTTRLYMTEEGISELEDITTEASKMENIGETTTKQNIQELWNSYKRCTVGKMGILRGSQEQKQSLKQQWLEFPPS